MIQASYNAGLQSPDQHCALRFDDVTQRFPKPSGEMHTALEGVSFDACAGTFLSVVGPSGCGKSTLLHIAAGLLQPTRGSVFVFGQRLDGVNHRASYMFQQDALLPWKNVRENVALGLTFRGRSAAESNQLAAEWIRRVGLDGFGDSYPAQLSGGMRKRVAMAQSWIVDPDIVLMDEPFAALDVHTRLRMENEILDLWAGSGKTVLFITHDLEEAIGLSDEVAVLSVGPGSRIIARHKVDLARPRNLLDIRTESRFQELYKTIWSGLRQEVLRSYERD